MVRRLLSSLSLALALAAGARAQSAEVPEAPAATVGETLQVTATRIPEEVADLPAAVTVISAAELAARGATDLAAALALAAGVFVAPGGDGGPASSVPELMGLREFDAFLLVVDGVPWGGAFNPALASLDLAGVERIEVLRGSAPVLFGATSFVGVIHVLHAAAGEGARAARLGGGRFGSFAGAVTAPLAAAGGWRQSLAANAERRGFADERAGVERGHLLYRGAGDLAGGRLRFDVDLAKIDQDPTSPVPRQGRVLSPLVPLDSNQNPQDARIDEQRLHLVGGYDRQVGGGDWSTTLALTRVERDLVRGFLFEDFEGPGDNAAGYTQEQEETDYFLDSHWAVEPSETLSIVAGFDLLGGKGEMKAHNFDYRVALDGADAPSSAGQQIEESPELDDERAFAGIYAQAIWRPVERWRLEAGVRLNQTREKRDGEVETDAGEERASDSRNVTRGGGSLGASFRVWGGGGNERDAIWLFADWRDTYKPAAIDFGPEAEGEILDPETATTWEAGAKGAHLGGRLTWQVSAFRMDFDNLVVAQSIDGRPALANAGQERFEGVELEGAWRPRRDLAIQASYSWHDPRFRDYVQDFGGVPTQLSGRQLEMAPQDLAALGVSWFPERGIHAHAEAQYVGEHFLNKRNTASADAYTLCSAGVGWRFARFDLRLDGWNLGDVRDAVAESELGEGQYYRMPARTLEASLAWRF